MEREWQLLRAGLCVRSHMSVMVKCVLDIGYRFVCYITHVSVMVKCVLDIGYRFVCYITHVHHHESAYELHMKELNLQEVITHHMSNALM